jgi:hypothetical protein
MALYVDCAHTKKDPPSGDLWTAFADDEILLRLSLDAVKRQAVIVRVSHMGGVGDGFFDIVAYLVL